MNLDMLRTKVFATTVARISGIRRYIPIRTINTVTKKNISKIEKLCEVLEVNPDGYKGKERIPTKELTKLLYTTSRNMLVRVPMTGDLSTGNTFETRNETLQKLGEQLIHLEINKMLTITFTNFNQFNIMNKNFNYIHNLDRARVVNMDSISWLIKNSLKINQLAHLRIPANLPKEMGLTSSSNDFQNLNDWKVILSFIGYLKLLEIENDNKKFIESIIKTICIPLINYHLRKS
ncbi:AAR_G0008370.mRNA.1.CDS.1 [Saccharomyces cerevisiae]|nr:CNB_1a_G0008140.mRNA.1.CDS.1 [Saccharomyces cerevisiae]CAI4317687.1 AAR_G0008370.mRNA.1.CDS.1 [Saccharomyces cerevisiae]CAI4318837.1 AIG_G0008230.mRNA.1.CDS.1 [Saccharomyces cerevisiae]CAI4324633.1 AGK_G0008170.mRNA.1.CDS.1 [Saccharomyces cerevisiae]CAI4327530.1 AEG_G0008430.mRNA.1.CDS.1 [Saccharomyces cerevisiae]